jgi:Ser-tRNA(Ala) deacylase AlaX
LDQKPAEIWHSIKDSNLSERLIGTVASRIVNVGEHDPNIGNEQRDVTIHIDFEEIRAQLMHFHTALKQLSKGFPWKNGNELQTSLYVRLHK